MQCPLLFKFITKLFPYYQEISLSLFLKRRTCIKLRLFYWLMFALEFFVHLRGCWSQHYVNSLITWIVVDINRKRKQKCTRKQSSNFLRMYFVLKLSFCGTIKTFFVYRWPSFAYLQKGSAREFTASLTHQDYILYPGIN